jgi:fluoroquinolone resistance protein
MHFSEQEYDGETFEALEAKGAELRERIFEGCRFVRCNLGAAVLRSCRFVDCTFEHCDLSNLAVAGCTFRDVKFLHCKAIGINWATAAVFDHAEFEKSVVTLACFAGLDLKKTVLRDCSAREADFSETDLGGADLRGTDFAGARFSRTNLQKADLRGAKNYTIRAEDNRLKNARFSLPEATLLLYGLGIELEE